MEQTNPQPNMSGWKGRDFEFLIVGDIQISNEEFDEIMTPNSMHWSKFEKNGWPHYKVDEDDFNYSWEMPGIQMTFNDEISFDKARMIADEVVANIKATGQNAELQIIDSTKVNQF
ncbi:MAG: hypothetical protein V4490_07850 [Pseudomonadota bacterium]